MKKLILTLALVALSAVVYTANSNSNLPYQAAKKIAPKTAEVRGTSIVRGETYNWIVEYNEETLEVTQVTINENRAAITKPDFIFRAYKCLAGNTPFQCLNELLIAAITECLEKDNCTHCWWESRCN